MRASAIAWTACPPGNRGNDGERIGGSDGRCFFGRQVAQIFVVQIQVNKGAQLSFMGKQVLAQFGMSLGQLAQGLGDGGGAYLDGVPPLHEGTQRRGDKDGHVFLKDLASTP